MSSADELASLATGLHEAAETPEDTRSLGALLCDELAIFRREHEAAIGFTGFAQCPSPPE